MPTKWPMEALKAQAIASRTYALKQRAIVYLISILRKEIKSTMVLVEDLQNQKSC